MLFFVWLVLPGGGRLFTDAKNLIVGRKIHARL
jgi:hypothetical protein